MTHQEPDKLADHLSILETAEPLTLDPAFFDRLKVQLQRQPALRERRALRQAGLATGILALLFTLNLLWLARNPARGVSNEDMGLTGFATFYGQSISSDL
jgi:hypothetical protein